MSLLAARARYLRSFIAQLVWHRGTITVVKMFRVLSEMFNCKIEEISYTLSIGHWSWISKDRQCTAFAELDTSPYFVSTRRESPFFGWGRRTCLIRSFCSAACKELGVKKFSSGCLAVYGSYWSRQVTRFILSIHEWSTISRRFFRFTFSKMFYLRETVYFSHLVVDRLKLRRGCDFSEIF